MTPNKPIIGVTGNSGSGKGTVCAILKGLGGFYLDTDHIAHTVMEYGKPAYTEISNMFGDGILLRDKSIDRKKLGDIVFRDPAKRKALERIVHTQVKLICGQLTRAALHNAEYAFIVWDAPLLAEAGMHKECSLVLLVTAPFAFKVSRIMNRDCITEERALLRLSNQPPDNILYKGLVDDLGTSHVKIIENSGSIQDLEYKTRMAVRPLGD